MRVLLITLVLTALAAQQPAAEPGSPVPDTEAVFTGSMDVGYRWRTDVAGSFNSFRSVVNLGEGPKLLGAEFTLRDPHRRLFDSIEARGYNWGDDPYTSLRVNAKKQKLYDLGVDYRNIAYFNFLPSFANPLLDRGILLNQQSYDVHRRLTSVQLDLLPGNWLVPYLAYGRSSGFGNGITTFVADGNEYPIGSRLRVVTSDYRGGIRFELRRVHLTLEQGGTTYKDDQQVFWNSGAVNAGNRAPPLLGQNLLLATLAENYGIRGSTLYSKGLLTASPFSWLDVYGQFLYSRPEHDLQFQQFNTGNFADLSQALFFNAQQFLVSANSKLPHTSAGFGFELRPLGRLRILESWLTDRLHVSSFERAQNTVTPARPALESPVPQSGRLVTNYSQQEINLLLDLTTKLTLRGGYRYVWGDAQDAITPVSGLAGPESGELRRQVGIGGVTFRPLQRLQVNGEIEAASSDRVYFRTSLRDYQKMRARARFQALAALSLAADFSLLNNQNPAAGNRYDYLFRQNSFSVLWSPQGGRRFSLQADYTRSTFRSDLSYLAPQTLQPERSFYRDNAHLASALVDVPLPGWRKLNPKLAFGGSLAMSSGSRPTSYFQPLGRLAIPLSPNVAWISQWRYYGFGEVFYQFEGFRTHLITTGLRFTR